MSSPDTSEIASANQAIVDLINSKQSDLSKMQVVTKLLEIEDKKIIIVGEENVISNLELITEYPSVNYTKMMVKNETWRKSVQQVLHRKDINDEKIIGYMDMQFIIKMISHRRKRSQEVVNAVKNEVAGTEVIPSNTRKKKFFGMV